MKCSKLNISVILLLVFTFSMSALDAQAAPAGPNESDSQQNYFNECNPATQIEPCPVVEPVCGNGFIENGESCDDGNTVSNDGCDSQCQPEPICGNGIKEGLETCDDGNLVSGDGCDSECQYHPICGNGVQEIGEACDDGNTLDGDGCDSQCQPEPICGDGNKDAGEACDDGNADNSDGCDTSCQEVSLVIHVDRTDDSPDAAAQVCSDEPNDCTLRGAVIKANVTTIIDEVIVPASDNDYILDIPKGNEADNNTGNDPTRGDVDMLHPIIITGAGADQTVIHADDLLDDRIFHSPGGSGNTTITGLTLENGNAGFRGGAIWNYNGDLTVKDCIIQNNYALVDGGGVSFDTGSTLTVINTTFLNNSTTARGGGLFFETGNGTITNSTFSGNFVTGDTGNGGAYSMVTGTIEFEHVTFYDNEAQGANGAGGALFVSDNVTLKLKNSLLADNIVNGTIDENCSGVIVSLGHNVSSDNSCDLNETGDQNDVLGTLVEDVLFDDGNGHLTHTPTVDSAAIDAVTDTNACGLLVDQEGNTRPADGDGDGVAFCDAGAVEIADETTAQQQSETESTTKSGTTSGASNTTSSQSGCSLISTAGQSAHAAWLLFFVMGMGLVVLRKVRA